MNLIKLNSQLARLNRNTPMTGVFKQILAEFDHRKIVLVTCVGNEEGKEGYDPDGRCITGSYYELVDGNMRVVFDFPVHLKAHLQSLIDVEGIKDFPQQQAESPEQLFVESVEAAINSPQISVSVEEGEANYFTIQIDNPFISNEHIRPTDALVAIIREQGLAILGKEVQFDNIRRSFWF